MIDLVHNDVSVNEAIGSAVIPISSPSSILKTKVNVDEHKSIKGTFNYSCNYFIYN